MAVCAGQFRSRPRPRGFTLIEALMATGILLTVVVSVTAAITAGQQHAYEAHERIAGTLAAEELMGRLTTEEYPALLGWNGYSETAGEMIGMDGKPMPDSFDMVGRSVQVTTALRTLPGLNIKVKGRSVNVMTFNAQGRVLAELSHFIPEPKP